MTKQKITESRVKIDLKEPFSPNDVRKLIKSVRDDRTWRLVVTYNGTAYLCDGDEVRHRLAPRAQNRKLAKKRDTELLKQKSDLVLVGFEGFCQGNGYVGTDAAKDQDFVNQLYNDLKASWPKEAK